MEYLNFDVMKMSKIIIILELAYTWLRGFTTSDVICGNKKSNGSEQMWSLTTSLWHLNWSRARVAAREPSLMNNNLVVVSNRHRVS